MDYLVRVGSERLGTLGRDELTDLMRRERARGRELVVEGVLRQLWRTESATLNWSLWSAPDLATLHATFATLPASTYLDFDVTPVTTHPLITGDDSDLNSSSSL